MTIKHGILALVVAGLAASSGVAAQASGSNGSSDHKTSICHRTHSATNPFVLISIDDSAVPAHMREHGDDAFPRNGECPPTAAGWSSDDSGGDSGGTL